MTRDEAIDNLRKETVNKPCTCVRVCWSGDLKTECRRCETLRALAEIIADPRLPPKGMDK